MNTPEAAPQADQRTRAEFKDDGLWSIQFGRGPASRHSKWHKYPIRQSPIRVTKNSTQPSVVERFWDRNSLAPEANLALTRLVNLGATELKEGFSTRLLRRAHRRLAKQFHPDLVPGKSVSFRELTSAYLVLNKFSLSDGNEFVSARACPRRDAA